MNFLDFDALTGENEDAIGFLSGGKELVLLNWSPISCTCAKSYPNKLWPLIDYEVGFSFKVIFILRKGGEDKLSTRCCYSSMGMFCNFEGLDSVVSISSFRGTTLSTSLRIMSAKEVDVLLILPNCSISFWLYRCCIFYLISTSLI